jgi:hypothetical protein
MSTTATPARADVNDVNYEGDKPRRLTTETKASFKTTEFIVYILMVIGVLVASAVTDGGADNQSFGAKSAWLYVTLLTIGYMISRGLAKSGSPERYDA